MKGKFEIMAIPNKYKDTFDDLIDSSDIKSSDHPDSPNRPELIDKELHNVPKSKNSLLTFLEEDHLDKNISITSLEPTPKIQDSQVHQCHNIATLGTKSERI